MKSEEFFFSQNVLNEDIIEERKDGKVYIEDTTTKQSREVLMHTIFIPRPSLFLSLSPRDPK